MKRIVKEKGITLVALIVTIVVLLILAGISIRMAIGDEGIITETKYAKDETEKADILERVQLQMTTLTMRVSRGAEKFDNNTIEKYLNNEFGSEYGDQIIVTESGSNFTTTIGGVEILISESGEAKIVDDNSNTNKTEYKWVVAEDSTKPEFISSFPVDSTSSASVSTTFKDGTEVSSTYYKLSKSSENVIKCNIDDSKTYNLYLYVTAGTDETGSELVLNGSTTVKGMYKNGTDLEPYVIYSLTGSDLSTNGITILSSKSKDIMFYGIRIVEQ